jgi:hypothetical protein
MKCVSGNGWTQRRKLDCFKISLATTYGTDICADIRIRSKTLVLVSTIKRVLESTPCSVYDTVSFNMVTNVVKSSLL